LEELSREELIAVIKRQAEELERLHKLVEETLRKRHRQATPFSTGKRKASPERPGRKAGEGQFERRPAPPASITDRHVEVAMPAQCPSCGGVVDLERTEEATVVDAPRKPTPEVTRYRVPVCRCRKCGAKVRGKTGELAGDQTGATAHRLGPRIKALAHMLHYGLGVPVRKVPEILLEMTGIRVTASTLTQDALRQAAKGPIGEQYRTLREAMRHRAVVHTDDTGWRIGGVNAHLMGFDSPDLAVYQIRYQHRNEEVQEIIPRDFAGVLVTDRGKSYDAEAFLGMMQQKCLSHLLRNISETLERKAGPARRFGVQVQSTLRAAIELSRKEPTPSREQEVNRLDERLTWLLRNRILKDDDNQRLLNGIGTQMDRGRLLTFLRIPGVPATNNAAERILRPAVIARKVSQCSKNDAGAEATSAFLSVIQTLRKRATPGISVAALLMNGLSRS
jgi:transposase